MSKLIKGVNDLVTTNPQLAKEWHPTKNGDLKPEDVIANSHQKVWWLLPYDDPKTGKHFDFEWETEIRARYRGNGCPFLSGKAVWVGFNDLATINPELAKQWHPKNNGDLKPTQVTANSNKTVWWYLPYDDSVTGQHFDFEWQAPVCNRTEGKNCPFLSGKAVWIGFNDLNTTNPELTKQWHPKNNGDLKPTQVTANSNKTVWWLYPYDTEDGKHFDFEWQSDIQSRNKGNGCPFLSGQAVWVGFNDLATVNPNLAKEWHPTKNGDLKPTQVTANSGLKVWWIYPYDDPKTGQHFNFEWQAVIGSRNSGIGCPFLSNPSKAVWVGFNDLGTVNPELAKEWHPTKNGDLKPTDVTANSGEKVWWIYPYDDPVTGKHFDFEWEATIADRNSGSSCPYLSGKSVWIGFNDLVTIRPDLAKEWHPTKNGDLKPEDVTANSGSKVWWIYPYDDPKSGKHFDFEWQTTVANRNSGSGCPYLSGYMVYQGFNDLATINPQLAKEWHPIKNGILKPTDVTTGSKRKVWWYLPYDDPITGKHFDFEWRTRISHRCNGIECPFLSKNNPQIWPGFNDLATINPNLAKQWHPIKNGDLKPENVFANSNKQVWWLLPYDDPKTGKHFDFEWQNSVYNRNNGSGCPFFNSTTGLVWQGFNDLATVNPELAKEWHPTKNGDLKPTDVTVGTEKYVWWLLPYDDPVTGKHFDFEWKARINNRNNGCNCPYLSGKKILIGFNDLATVNPELAKEWHPTKNGDLKPTDVTSGTNKMVWWKINYYDYKEKKNLEFEWCSSVHNRMAGYGCPYISSSKTERLLYNFIKNNNMSFELEYSFSNCRDILPLPFDVYLPDKNIIIECDGIQHFKLVEYFGGKDALKKNQKHDRIKNKFCKDNNISILRIPYEYDPIVDKEKIETFVMDFIKTKTVPQEILDYYAQYKFSNYLECAKELNEKALKN